MNLKLLKKIEERALYTLSQEKIKKQKELIKKTKKRFRKLERLLIISSKNTKTIFLNYDI